MSTLILLMIYGFDTKTNDILICAGIDLFSIIAITLLAIFCP